MAKTKTMKGKGTGDCSPLAGFLGPKQGAAYAMYPNRGKAAPKKGNGIANALAGYHQNRGKM